MKHRNIIALLLAVILVLGTCTACTKENGKNSDNSNQLKLSPVGEYPIVTNGKAELTVWSILSSDCSDYETNQQSVWYEEYSGVKVKWVNVPASGWADAFQLSVVNGDLPDIYIYPFDTSEVDICAEYKAIIPLNDLIEDYAPNINEYLENNPEIRKTITNRKGEIYTLFNSSYNVGDAYKQKLWVNKSWLEKYTEKSGIEMPSTTEEFEDMLVFFKENDMNNNNKNDEIPMMGKNGVDGVYNLANAFVPSNSAEGYGCVADENGKVKEFAYATEEFRDALKYMNNLYKQGLISDQTFTISDEERYKYTSVDNSSVGVVTAPSISQIVLLGNSKMDYDDYVAIPPLKGPKGVRGAVTLGENTLTLRNAITSACKQPELAMRWLDYFYSTEGQLWSINGGLQGEHWKYETKTDNGVETKTLVHNKNVDVTDNFCWGKNGVNYMLTEEDMTHIDKSELSTNANLADYLANEAYSEYGIESGWDTIVWTSDDLKEVASEYSEIVSLIKNHVTESYTNFVLGTKDINDDAAWKVYIDKLKELKVDRLVELTELYISLS